MPVASSAPVPLTDGRRPWHPSGTGYAGAWAATGWPPYPGWPAPAGTRRRIRWPWYAIGGTLIAVAAVVAGVIAAGPGPDRASQLTGSHVLITPEAAGDYTRITGAVADRLTSQMRDSLSGRGLGDPGAAQIAVYGVGSSSEPALLYVGLPLSGTSLGRQSASARVDEFLMGAQVRDSTDVDSSLYGQDGVFRCGGSSPTVCAWSDDDTLGGLVYFENPLSLDYEPPQFRGNAEH